MLGRKITELLDTELSAGNHTISFNASKLSSGLYIYTLEVNNLKISKKMLLLK